MTYTFLSAQYANEESTAAIAITAESAAVLLSIEDTPSDWACLHDWGEPAAYAPPVAPAPTVVSASQAKIALLDAGLLDGVEAVVAAHPYRPVRIWYADANEWHRGHAYVQALGAELGLTDQTIDRLFIAAASL